MKPVLYKFSNCFLLFFLCTFFCLSEKKPTAAQLKFFESKIRPVLVKHCYKCHSVGGKKIGGKLLLDSKERMNEGGVSGPLLDLDNPDKSLLIEAIKGTSELEMPPKHPLSKAVVNDFMKWVEMGAPYPQPKKENKVVRKTVSSDLWSLKKLLRHKIPKTKRKGWVLSEIDSFVLAKIEEKGKNPAEQATAAALLKRLYIDIVGLLPSMDEVQSFSTEYQVNPQKAVRKTVDRLIASPEFGVRWGRFWLDIARYAESNGKDSLGRNPTFPHAWRYRDYVIESINADKPINQFLIEQIAGDLLIKEPQAPAIASSVYDVHRGAARASDGNSESDNFWASANNQDIGAWWQLDLGSKKPVREVEIKFRGFGGKYHFVPRTISFQVSDDGKKWKTALKKSSNVPASKTAFKNQPFKYDINSEGRFLRLLFEDGTDDKVGKIKVVELVEVTVDGKTPHTALDKAEALKRDNNLIATGFLTLGSKPAAAMNNNFAMDVVANQIELIGEGVLGLSIACARCHDHKFDPITDHDYYAMAGILTSTETLWGLAGHEKLSAPPTQLHILKTYSPLIGPEGFKETAGTFDTNTGKPKRAKIKLNPKNAYAMGLRDKSKVGNCKVNINGESRKLGPAIPRGFLSAVKFDGKYSVNGSSSGRLQLAKWLTDPSNPLTSRVFVNRIWQRLFGEGLVRTPNDFGTHGELPSHPKLLDHLAHSFMDNNWSLKELIRNIVLSRSYQLSSGQEEMVKTDPENFLLTYHKVRRFDAETFRDCVLQTTGQLDLNPGKGSIIGYRDILVENAGKVHIDSKHRSIYLCYLRDSLPLELRPFDLPDFRKVTGQRTVSVKTSQTLFLFNSPFIIEQASHFADILSSGKTNVEKTVTAYNRTFFREPTPEELTDAQSFVLSLDPEKYSEKQRWAAFCQILLSSNEFRHTD